MIEPLAELAQLWREGLFAAALVFLRVGAVMALLPAFGEQTVPVRVRLALAVAFALVVTPAASGAFPAGPVGPAQGAALAATEIAAGLALGLGLRLLVLGLQTAGVIAAQSVSLSQIFGGSPGTEPQPAFANLLTAAALALAVGAGLHVKAAGVLIASYEVFPPGAMPDAAAFAGWGTRQVAQAFATGFTLSAPFVVASLAYNVGLGVINRAMPQLMVTFVGAPVLTFGGLALLALLAPAMLEVWLGMLDRFLADPFGGPS